MYMYSEPGNRKTLTRQVLTSITYPDLNALPPVAPSNIVSQTYCNGLREEQEFAREEITKEITTRTMSCFHWDLSTTAGLGVTWSATITGGVPGLYSGEASSETNVHWQVTAGAGNENCRENTQQETRQIIFPVVIVPPRTSRWYTFTQYQGRLNGVSFSANLEQHWSDGDITTKSITGTYDGVFYSSLAQSYHDERTVDSCARRLVAENETVV